MAGAVGGAVGGQVISGAIGYGLQKDAQAHQKNVLKNQKQWLVADLKAAGLNPILAAGGLGGQVSGGGGVASPGSGQDLGEAFRKGSVFKALKAKAISEAVTAKNVEQMSHHQAMTAGSVSSIEYDNSIMKSLEQQQATARHKNVMEGIKSRKELDAAGIPAFGLSGSDLRKFNAVIQQLRGKDQTGAGKE